MKQNDFSMEDAKLNFQKQSNQNLTDRNQSQFSNPKKKQQSNENKLLQISKNEPKTYSDLIQKVGNNGIYQRNLFLIFSLVLFICGAILLGTSFLFLNSQYNCSSSGLLVADCKKLVCSIQNIQQRKKYFIKNKQNVDSIATEFGPFLCEDQYILDMLTACPYLGSFLGFVLFSLFTDNFGRRSTMIVSLSSATLGSILISSAVNLVMVSIGLILVGGGINTATTIVFIFLSQIVGDLKRQKYSVFVQSMFTLGVIVTISLYYFLHNWRIVSTIIITIPMVILLIAFVLYVEQTPIFLLKKSNQAALKALNRIGQINFKIKNILTQIDLQTVKSYQIFQHDPKNRNKVQQKVTILDLCRYQSLRSTAIVSCLTYYMITTIFYGPALIINQIGFNTYVTSYVGQFSQLIGYIPTFYFIDKIKRKKASFSLFFTAMASSFIIYLFPKPQNCSICFQSIIQVISIFVLRFAISIQLTLFNVYSVELFPTKIIGMGVGLGLMVGGFASTLTPIILGFLSRKQISQLLLFTICGFIGLSLSILLKQTQGKPIQSQIQEILTQKRIKTLEISSISPTSQNLIINKQDQSNGSLMTIQ